MSSKEQNKQLPAVFGLLLDQVRKRSQTQVALRSRAKWSSARDEFLLFRQKTEKAPDSSARIRSQTLQPVKESRREQRSSRLRPTSGEKDCVVFEDELNRDDGDYSKGWTVIMDHILNPRAPRSQSFRQFQKQRIDEKIKKLRSQKEATLLPPPPDERVKTPPEQPESFSPKRASGQIKMKCKLKALVDAKMTLSKLEAEFDSEQRLLSKIDRRFRMKPSASFDVLSSGVSREHSPPRAPLHLPAVKPQRSSPNLNLNKPVRKKQSEKRQPIVRQSEKIVLPALSHGPNRRAESNVKLRFLERMAHKAVVAGNQTFAQGTAL